MPSRTRTKAVKPLKENIDVVKKNKVKPDGKVSKPPRKALADKTNSLSDDNASIDVPIKTTKTVSKANVVKNNTDEVVKPRRERRLPKRYAENKLLKNLSNSKDSPVKQRPVAEPQVLIERVSDKVLQTLKTSKDAEIAVSRPKRNCPLPSVKETPAKPNTKSSNANTEKETPNDILETSSPFKTPPKALETSLVTSRPKRVHRLPSRFEDHSISPNKFIPVQPCHASTPIVQKNARAVSKEVPNQEKVIVITDKDIQSNQNVKKAHLKTTQKENKVTKKKNEYSSNSSLDKSSPDTNNNGKNKAARAKKVNVKTKLPVKSVHSQANKITMYTKRILDKSLSFRILEDKRKSKKDENLDVYEFTYDPNEEPPPQKKKRKRVVKKKDPKPKTVTFKSNYNENVSKAIANLKCKVKPTQPQTVQNNVKPNKETAPNTEAPKVLATDIPPNNNCSPTYTPADPPINESVAKISVHESNYASIRIEDIAADFEPSQNHDIDYSPVNSPLCPVTPSISENQVVTQNKDPLNLLENESFFDEHPVASSSMNVSVRHPLASPWRVEFGNLPIKWHANTYVKPNMTPAVESSFINSEDVNKKKHVYTNLIEDNKVLPEIAENNPPALKQTSIISFIKEVAERKANKKKRLRSVSPTKANSIFEDVSQSSDYGYKTPKKAKKATKAPTPNVSNDTSNKSDENSKNSNKTSTPDKSKKKKEKNCTYFGFDDSENVDQENVSPAKDVPNLKVRGLRSKSRAVLHEVNTLSGPSRAAMPISAKSKLTSSEIVNQLYDQLKSSEDASQFPEKVTAKEPAAASVTNVDQLVEEEDDEQSVHLFEDIEVVHHLKPQRKSYGKAKKVTFQQNTNSDSDTEIDNAMERANSDYEDDLADLTFQMPDVKQKKKKKKSKKLLSKKEEKEVEEWAAGFNSMCEDIDEFPLVVE